MATRVQTFLWISSQSHLPTWQSSSQLLSSYFTLRTCSIVLFLLPMCVVSLVWDSLLSFFKFSLWGVPHIEVSRHLPPPIRLHSPSISLLSLHNYKMHLFNYDTHYSPIISVHSFCLPFQTHFLFFCVCVLAYTVFVYASSFLITHFVHFSSRTSSFAFFIILISHSPKLSVAEKQKFCSVMHDASVSVWVAPQT